MKPILELIDETSIAKGADCAPVSAMPFSVCDVVYSFHQIDKVTATHASNTLSAPAPASPSSWNAFQIAWASFFALLAAMEVPSWSQQLL